MRNVMLFASLLSLSLSLCAFAETSPPLYRGEPSSAYLRIWALCGPFPLVGDHENVDNIRLSGMFTDYLRDIGGEEKPHVVMDTEGNSNVPIRWKHHISPYDYIDLDGAVSQQATGIAYAYCEIQCEKNTPALFLFGANDGGRVWLNGEEIITHPASGGLKFDLDAAPVLLQRGKNTLLAKIEERGNKWQFAARFVPWDLKAVQDRTRIIQVISTKEGGALFHMNGSSDLWHTLADKIDLSVAPAATPDQEIWRGTWGGKKDTPLGIDKNLYRDYVLRVAFQFKGGEKSMTEIPFRAGTRDEHVIFENGTTDYSIVLNSNPSESERWAAEEMRHWLHEVSGADFPIVNMSSQPPQKAIYIGYDDSFQKLWKTMPQLSSKPPLPGDESFQYFNMGPSIFILGGRDRGTMYGVMSFLEREMGVRFYTPRVTVAPKKQRYAFTCLEHAEKPGIRVRNDFYFEAFDPIWAAHNRVNGAMTWREQPGGLECYWAVHTFFPLVPPEEFFASHPEYYSLVDGKRQYERAQLCLTNPDVLQIVIDRIKKKMRELPQYLIYDVSQNDWGNPCQCEKCQAIAKAEGSESGVVIWFVNQVADAVKKEFPDKFIGTLAYQYTRKPPKTIKPRDNVVVRLCSIECCFAHDFRNCPENESFVEDMEGWAKLAPHLYIWDYVVNFSHYIMPYPNFRVLQPNIQFFRDHNAIGIMEQAAYQSRGGEFAELRAYVLSKLLWDPEIDVPSVIDDFMYGYYGRAGQYVKAYFDLLHNQITPDTHIHLGLSPEDKIFSDDFVRKAERLFDEAEKVADNEEIRQRVEVARLPIMYLKCRRSPIEAKADGTYDRFKAIVAREGITHYAEAGEPHRRAFHEMMDAVEIP